MKHLKSILQEMEQKLGRDDPNVVDVRWHVLEGETVLRAEYALTRSTNAGVPVVRLEFDVHERIASLLREHADRLEAWNAVAGSGNLDARYAAAQAETHAYWAVLRAVHEALPDLVMQPDDVVGQILDMLRAAWQVESNHFGRT